MKALIISDIHGGYKNLKKVIDDNLEFDYLICAGDFLSGGDLESVEETVKLINEYNVKLMACCGNCDSWGAQDRLDFPLNDYTIFPMDGMLIFLTHGDLYNRQFHPDVDFDVYIQGHTHIPEMKEENGKIYLNPGSISLPRGMSGKTYIFYHDMNFELRRLEDGKVLKKIQK